MFEMRDDLYFVDWAKHLLRNAFNVSSDYCLSNEDVEELRIRFASILPYFIIFTARSGSTFLTFELDKSNTLGAPHEWFNYDNVSTYIRDNPMSFTQYFSEAVETSKSANNVFGCKINWPQFSALSSIVDVESIFPNPIRWFVLFRRNIVSQAVSHYIARSSGVYHSYQLTAENTTAINKLEYNATEIMSDIEQIIQQEEASRSWLKERGVNPVELYYEDVVSDPKATAMLFSNVMGTRLFSSYLEGQIANPITKMPGVEGGEYEARLRREEVSFIKRATARRPPIKHYAREV